MFCLTKGNVDEEEKIPSPQDSSALLTANSVSTKFRENYFTLGIFMTEFTLFILFPSFYT